MSNMILNNKKLYSKTLPLNDGTKKTFDYKGWNGLKNVIAEYVAAKAVSENRACDYTVEELIKAPWMVTQTALLMEVNYSSVSELLKNAQHAYGYILV
ncbi:hypothetical protein IJJ53_03840 [Candidatus Saccharibacteria bacterium]|nr:hypothetical protein [Candidatus Saccharibacteria bacterium]